MQGKTLDAAREIVDDAVALAEAGCFAVVLECVPDAVARLVTDSIPVPTIGIGAGRHCDGQVLVYHDLLGLEDCLRPKFVRRYAEPPRRRGRRGRAVRRRRARRQLPVERRDVPRRRRRRRDLGLNDSVEPHRDRRSASTSDDDRGRAVARSRLALVVAGVDRHRRRGRRLARRRGDDGGSARRRRVVAPAPTPAAAPFVGLTEAQVAVGGRCLRVVVADDDDGAGAGAARSAATSAPYDGMLFVFDAPTETTFTMSTVPVPLEIGFYAADGSPVSRRAHEAVPARRSRVPGLPSRAGRSPYALETLSGEAAVGRTFGGVTDTPRR